MYSNSLATWLVWLRSIYNYKGELAYIFTASTVKPCPYSLSYLALPPIPSSSLSYLGRTRRLLILISNSSSRSSTTILSVASYLSYWSSWSSSILSSIFLSRSVLKPS